MIWVIPGTTGILPAYATGENKTVGGGLSPDRFEAVLIIGA